jgi:hypothetical protein
VRVTEGGLVNHTREEQVKCPSCSQPGVFRIWDSVNVTADPELKDRFLSADLNTFRCEGCGQETQIWYPMLYHDSEQGLMIWLMLNDEAPPALADLLPGMTGGSAEGYLFRLVSTPNELKEKIFIADSGLDDRVVELMKWLIRQNDHGQNLQADDILLFAQVEEVDAEQRLVFVILRESEQMASALPAAMYDELAEAAEQQLDTLYGGVNPWLRVHESQLSAMPE